MKNIEAISIWDKGQSKQAVILNTYAINVSLGNSATFWYGLLSADMELLAQGNLVMGGEDYQLWDADEFAWEFIASQLGLVISGDYVQPEPVIEEVIEE